MKIYLFCCRFDSKIHDYFQEDPKIIIRDLRSLIGSEYFENSVILLSEHSTNKRLIQYIRKFNVLIPIYIVSESKIFYHGSNGSINIENLNYTFIQKRLRLFPQRFVWDFVFQHDQQKRQLAIQSNNLT